MTPSMQKALFVSVLIALAAPAPAQPPNRLASVRGVLPQPPTDRHVLLGA
jgi:hypothetical protein